MTVRVNKPNRLSRLRETREGLGTPGGIRRRQQVLVPTSYWYSTLLELRVLDEGGVRTLQAQTEKLIEFAAEHAI